MQCKHCHYNSIAACVWGNDVSLCFIPKMYSNVANGVYLLTEVTGAPGLSGEHLASVLPEKSTSRLRFYAVHPTAEVPLTAAAKLLQAVRIFCRRQWTIFHQHVNTFQRFLI